MEMRPGYKRSEFGSIPEDWEVTTVGGEFSVQLGKMLDAGRNAGIPKPYLGNRSVQWGLIDITDLPTVPMSPSDLDKFRLMNGDLLVCEGGEVGRAAIWNAPIDDCYYQKALHRLRPKRNFDQRLMVDILREWSRRGLLANYVTQTSIAHLPRDKFIEVPIPRPSVPEQRAIAEALGDVDALVDALDRLIAKKRGLKQATMQQLLSGQTRLPGFHGEWKMQPLGSVGQWFSGGTPNMANDLYWNGDIPWVSAKDMKVLRLRDSVLHVTRKAIGSGTRIAQTGALLIVVRGMILAHTLPVAVATRPVAFNQDLKALVTHTGINSEFVLAWLQVNAQSVLGIGTESTHGTKRLASGDLFSLKVGLPPFPEQSAIADVLTDIDAEIVGLEQRREKTGALKQAMMQELLTGRTRLL